MRSIFKISVLVLLFQNFVFSIGTQFLAIPTNNFELISGYNPILFRPSIKPTISVTYGNWLADMKMTNISFSKGMMNGYGGFDLRYVSLNDLELRTERPSDDPISYFSSSAYTVDGWYGRNFGSSSIQITARYLSIQLYDEDSDGFAFDITANKRFRDKFSVGAAVLNIGTMSKMYEEKPELPMRIIVGAQVDLNLKKIENEIAINIEKSTMVDGLIFRISDYISYKDLQFMMGSQYANKEISVSGGLNIALGNYTIGYSAQIGSQALGIPQYLNLSVILP